MFITMSELASSKSLRKVQRMLATKEIKNCNTSLTSLVDTMSTSEILGILKGVKCSVNLLNGIISKIENLNSSIYAALVEDELESEASDAESKMCEKILLKETILSEIHQWEKCIEQKIRKPDVNSDVKPEFNTAGAESNLNVKLPKLELPHFDGKLTDYTYFMESFIAAVDSKSLSNVGKFQYLKSCLRGPALKCIDGLHLSNSNYSVALTILKEKFGQTHRIISAHMECLNTLSCRGSKLSDLQYFYNALEYNVRSLEALGERADNFGSMLAPLLMSKLPAAIRMNIIRELGDKQYNLTEIREQIRSEIFVMENSSKGDTMSGGDIWGDQSFSSFHTNSQGRKCVFCQGNHFSSDCNKYNTTERINLVKSKRLCYNCLSGKHQLKDCSSQNRCHNCHKKHHTSICQSLKKGNSNISVVTTSNADSNTNKSASNLDADAKPFKVNSVFNGFCSNPTNYVLLGIASVEVVGSECYSLAHMLFDNGSQRSFITQEFSDLLNLVPIRKETIYLSTFGDKSNNGVRMLNVVGVKLKTCEGKLEDAFFLVIPLISRPITNSLGSMESYPHIDGLKLAHKFDNRPITLSLLMGSDQYWNFVGDEVVRGYPTAVNSKFGYILTGPTSASLDYNYSHSKIFNILTSHREDDTLLRKFWDLETIGICEPEEEVNKLSINSYSNDCITYIDGKYTAKLPWKLNHLALPDNYFICYKRTRSTIDRLARDPILLSQYNKIIQDQLKYGFIEVVPNDVKSLHFIPYHPVFKKSETTPIRIVYDCSCCIPGNLSLNDHLEQGSLMYNDIPSILIRFRLFPYACMSDLEKAFLQIGLHEVDRPFTTFLWLSNPLDPNSELLKYQFKVILFGARSSPFILCAVIWTHLKSNESDISSHMLRDIYADNFLSSFIEESELLSYYHTSRSLMKSAGFNLRSWASNSSILYNASRKENSYSDNDIVQVLGLNWNTLQDEITFKTCLYDSPLVTKREVLKYIGRLFDPLGLVNPLVVQAKIFIQKLWKLDVSWDQVVDLPLQLEWNTIVSSLIKISEIKFSRSFNFLECTHCQIHVFADASMSVYGAVSYLKVGSNIKLCMSKSRISPIKPFTMPKLELLGALICKRLGHYIHSVISSIFTHIEIYLWEDNQSVLHWLHTEKPLPKLISNILKKIHGIDIDVTWRYCPSADNPADILTRHCTYDTLYDNKLWWNGPSWLKLDYKLWPSWQYNPEFVPSTSVSVVNYISDTVSVVPLNLFNIIDISRYNSYQKFIRVVSYILKAVDLFKCKLVSNNCVTPFTYLKKAETLIISEWQTKHFFETISNLKLKKNTTFINQLNLFLDDNNIIRCTGRLQFSVLNFDAKFSILLPKNTFLTDMIIMYFHNKYFHCGVNATLNMLRQRFWIPQGRQNVRRIVSKCVTCRKICGKSYGVPVLPPLPSSRITLTCPYYVTGVDFTGALSVTQFGERIKAYLALFTCAVTRHIHLEVVSDMLMETFLLAYRRFCARRSQPRLMISDNAKTFKAADAFLCDLEKRADVVQMVAVNGCDWRFIPCRSPWMGGFYERLIGLTKLSLKKAVGRRILTLTELETLAVEIECSLNNRPLTYCRNDNEDLNPLTPSELFCGRIISTLPLLEDVDDEIADPTYGEDLPGRFKLLSSVINQFYKRWHTEYVVSLQERNPKPGTTKCQINVGDVVMIHDDSPRLYWKMGIVTSLHYGIDGIVRSVDLKTNYGTTNRAITKLFPLELNIT